MKRSTSNSLLTGAIILAAIGAAAQDGKLSIHVVPKQAYIFVDGHAIGEASKHGKLRLSAGEHKVQFANYGYVLADRDVTVTAKQTTKLDVTMEQVPGTVPGPFGAMTIEGANHDAIMLNGKTPNFFVGHGDEFNHDFWKKQELVVPPGTYQMSVQKGDKEVWSGTVDVPENKRVVIGIPKGVRKTVDWSRGQKLSSTPRFKVGTASATVAVIKPTAQLSASAGQINCGDASQLQWSSTDAPGIQIAPVGTVASSGQQAVHPIQTTTYQLTATGPGGTATADTTVNVNTVVQANVDLSPAEVRYKRVGDNVVENPGTTLNWSANNASNVSIENIGTVSPTGSQAIQTVPQKKDFGPVDEKVTYTLTATNVCGGTETKTATLHIVGEIEHPEVVFSMRSVYFPTDRPRRVANGAGLLPSEQDVLVSVAGLFKQYLEAKPDAHLLLAGHADERGPKAYNQPLSERRAEVAKQFLVEQGVPEANIETQAFGDEKNLSSDDVKQLVEQSSDLSADDQKKTLERLHTIALAYNRRVDITVSPVGTQSAVQYPFTAQDYSALVDRNGPGQADNVVQPAASKEKIGSKEN